MSPRGKVHKSLGESMIITKLPSIERVVCRRLWNIDVYLPVPRKSWYPVVLVQHIAFVLCKVYPISLYLNTKGVYSGHSSSSCVSLLDGFILLRIEVLIMSSFSSPIETFLSAVSRGHLDEAFSFLIYNEKSISPKDRENLLDKIVESMPEGIHGPYRDYDMVISWYEDHVAGGNLVSGHFLHQGNALLISLRKDNFIW